MPELPDVVVYVEALRERIVGQKLNGISIRGPFLLRSIAPPLDSLYGKVVREVRRAGKRIAIGLENDGWLVLHLMIAGRLHWRGTAPKATSKSALAVFQFESGCVILTEAGSQRRASLHITSNEAEVQEIARPGLEVLEASLPEFASVLTSANHTLKRALTDPRLFSGIGNAYSDEILHCARLSPVAMTQKLTPEQVEILYSATREVLLQWIDRLRSEAAGAFPVKVTAFRTGMSVHGRYGEPCPRCGSKIQRIRYASNETNYCAPCQTGGKLLADRALSRLLRKDWPRTLDEFEDRMSR